MGNLNSSSEIGTLEEPLLANNQLELAIRGYTLSLYKSTAFLAKPRKLSNPEVSQLLDMITEHAFKLVEKRLSPSPEGILKSHLTWDAAEKAFQVKASYGDFYLKPPRDPRPLASLENVHMAGGFNWRQLRG